MTQNSKCKIIAKRMNRKMRNGLYRTKFGKSNEYCTKPITLYWYTGYDYRRDSVLMGPLHIAYTNRKQMRVRFFFPLIYTVRQLSLCEAT